MPALNRRIEALEAKTATKTINEVFLIRLVAMGQTAKPLTEITHKGKTWHILPDESEEDFEARVKAEVFPGEGETGVILIAN